MKTNILTHTPGPWVENRGRIVQVIDGDEGRVIVHLPKPLNLGDGEANARLIAAAPDLLEALRSQNQSPSELPGFCNCPHQDGTIAHELHSTGCQIARAAIAKAEGKAEGSEL